MTKYITCKTWNNPEEQIVTHVGTDGKVYDKDTVISWIENGEDVAVKSGGNETKVVVKTSSKGNKYLTTTPDGSAGNNIDNLPNC